jgi:hypothetical protein
VVDGKEEVDVWHLLGNFEGTLNAGKVEGKGENGDLGGMISGVLRFGWSILILHALVSFGFLSGGP